MIIDWALPSRDASHKSLRFASSKMYASTKLYDSASNVFPIGLLSPINIFTLNGIKLQANNLVTRILKTI